MRHARKKASISRRMNKDDDDAQTVLGSRDQYVREAEKKRQWDSSGLNSLARVGSSQPRASAQRIGWMQATDSPVIDPRERQACEATQNDLHRSSQPSQSRRRARRRTLSRASAA
jgi:hypothetical protein